MSGFQVPVITPRPSKAKGAFSFASQLRISSDARRRCIPTWLPHSDPQNSLRGATREVNYGKPDIRARISALLDRQIEELRTMADNRYCPAITFGQPETTSPFDVRPTVRKYSRPFANESSAFHRRNIPTFSFTPTRIARTTRCI